LNWKKYLLIPGQKLYKRISFSCYICPLRLLWHEFDIATCAIFFSLKCHSVVCTCTYMYILSLETLFASWQNGEWSRWWHWLICILY
jgi:hypothetical protein